MIAQSEAYKIVMGTARSFVKERLPLEQASGRYLASAIPADRDLPPYDRATMDGIAIAFRDIAGEACSFDCRGMAAAGAPRQRLQGRGECLEIATGAVIPEGADTVVPYEDVAKEADRFSLRRDVKQGQNLHRQGSDTKQGSILLEPGTRIGAAEVAILASAGYGSVPVHGLPRVAVFSSGDELVPVEQTPLPHQVRSSNVHALRSALNDFGIQPNCRHLPDNPGPIREGLEAALATTDAVLLSGGVSRGKYDYIPEVLETLGVRKLFHRVAQRPGKPFWFGADASGQCRIFSFPGNPVSTFLNFHLYFRDWLFHGWEVKPPRFRAILAEPLSNSTQLTHFRAVRIAEVEGSLMARPIAVNSSGDFLSLARADGFARVVPKSQPLAVGTLVSVIPYNPLW